MDILRYKKLLKLEKNNSLSDDLYWELVRYDATIQSQINYNRRVEYLLLIKKYFHRRIDSYEFRRLFLIMQEEDSVFAYEIRSDLQKLETFELANDLSQISDLITEISTLCSDFRAIGYETEDDIAESEIKFYSSVKKHYLKLQKLLSISSKKNLYYEELILRSFKLLKWVIGSEILIIFLYTILGN